MAQTKSVGGNLFLHTKCLDPNFKGARLDQSVTATNGPLYDVGASAYFETEFGYVRAKYVKNNSARALGLGQWAQGFVNATIHASNAGGDAGPNTKHFKVVNASVTNGGTDRLVDCLVTVISAADAAPEGETARIVKNTSSTIADIYLDRALTTQIDRTDTVSIYSDKVYTNATNTAAATNPNARIPGGVVCATTVPKQGYGWIITKGLHPKGNYISNIAGSTSLRVNATNSRLEASGGTNVIPAFCPTAILVDFDGGSGPYWPVRVVDDVRINVNANSTDA